MGWGTLIWLLLVIMFSLGAYLWLPDPAIAAIIGGASATVIVGAIYTYRRIAERIQKLRWQEEERLRRARQREQEEQRNLDLDREMARRRINEPDQQFLAEEPRLRHQGGSNHLTLIDVQLILETAAHQRSLGRVINRDEIQLVRPILLIRLNTDKFVGRPIVFDFIVRGPRGGEKYRCAIEHTFTAGDNRVFSKKTALAISPRSAKGKWTLEVWMGGREYALQTFTIVEGDIDENFHEVMGADGELTPEAKELSRQLGDADIFDILE